MTYWVPLDRLEALVDLFDSGLRLIEPGDLFEARATQTRPTPDHPVTGAIGSHSCVVCREYAW